MAGGRVRQFADASSPYRRRVDAGTAALPFTLLQLALDIYYGFSMLSTGTSKLYLVANCLLYLSINVIGLLSSYLNELNARSFFLRGTCPSDATGAAASRL